MCKQKNWKQKVFRVGAKKSSIIPRSRIAVIVGKKKNSQIYVHSPNRHLNEFGARNFLNEIAAIQLI